MPTRRSFLAGAVGGGLWPAWAAAADAQLTPDALPGLHPTPEITPADRLYVQSWNRTPEVDPDAWRLEVGGAVARPRTLTLADLRARPAVRRYVTLICIGNSVSGEQIGTVEWTGTPLAALLAEARPAPGALKLLVHGADRFTQTLTMDLALAPTTLVAWAMNGLPLAPDHGFPARLVVPGRYGVKSAKWVTRLEVVTADALGHWEKQGWDDAAVVRTTSRVDAPAFFGRIERGPVLVAGVAVAGDRGIASVEVSTDGARTWAPAVVRPPLSPFSWRLWAYRWRPTRPGEHVLAARATDGRGGRQETRRERAFPKGSGGLHEVIVEVLPSALT
jgi:DMSO/TMAO reductase YedYZ molybdopterin-dependent catalytic subunit